MLLLTCQYFTSQAAQNIASHQTFQAPQLGGHNNPSQISLGPNATQAQIVNHMRRMRNKNPNCNHNSSAVYYQPHYSNVKYDDTNQGKKEEVLRKVFFKEASRTDQERNNPLSSAGTSIMGGNKPFNKLDT